MKQQKTTLTDAAKEVLKESLIAIIVLILCSVALVIGILLPRDLLSGLPFELLLFLAVVAVLAILYIISAVVALIAKIKSRINDHKNYDN
jgi:hypothetical protein